MNKRVGSSPTLGTTNKILKKEWLLIQWPFFLLACKLNKLVNGNKIQKVELKGDNYTLYWDSLDRSGKPIQKSPECRQMENTFPELAGGYHLPKYAKVIGVADPSSGGDISDPFRPKYAVELQLLDENGNEDKSVPIYPAVPLPVSSTGSQEGFCIS